MKIKRDLVNDYALLVSFGAGIALGYMIVKGVAIILRHFGYV